VKGSVEGEARKMSTPGVVVRPGGRREEAKEKGTPR